MNAFAVRTFAIALGSLAVAAAGVLIPSVAATPKDPSRFTRIGRPATRVDAREIVTGGARYALDLVFVARRD